MAEIKFLLLFLAINLSLVLGGLFGGDVKYKMDEGVHVLSRGQRQAGDDILYSDTLFEKGGQFKHVGNEYCYPAKGANENVRITAYQARDMDSGSKGGVAFDVSGGVGQSQVCIFLKTQYMGSYRYKFEVWGFRNGGNGGFGGNNFGGMGNTGGFGGMGNTGGFGGMGNTGGFGGMGNTGGFGGMGNGGGFGGPGGPNGFGGPNGPNGFGGSGNNFGNGGGFNSGTNFNNGNGPMGNGNPPYGFNNPGNGFNNPGNGFNNPGNGFNNPGNGFNNQGYNSF